MGNQLIYIVKACVAIMLLVGLFAFAKARHAKRPITDTHIVFQGDTPPLVSRSDVNNLLIQFQDTSQSTLLETIDLNKSENLLNTNEMIKNSEVSFSLDGVLEVEIQQRRPIARIMGARQAYLDEDNKIMPLSSEHTVMVPLVFNYDARYHDDLFILTDFLRKNKFLKSHFSQYVMDGENGFTLYALQHDVPVRLGSVDGLQEKLNNYRAFLEVMDEKGKPEEIDLRFSGQVVVKKQKANG